MSAIALAAVTIIKRIVLKVASEKFFEWLFFWAAKMLVESTKTDKDDAFLAKAKEIYFDKGEDKDG